MKKFSIILSLALLSGTAAFAQATITPAQPEGNALQLTAEGAPAIQWNETTHDFGPIPQGVPATVEFTFTNTGNADLVIESAKPGCGCTTPDWTKEPVKPGKQGYVKATYNAAAVGVFTKSVTVNSNAGTPTILYLKGEVKAKEAAAAPVDAPAAGH